MTCRHATPTDREVFRDLEPGPPKNTHFACLCGWNECRCPDRVPPAERPLDAAGLHSFTRWHVDGSPKTDYIIVRRKYCVKEACSNYTETNDERQSEAGGLRDLPERT